MVIKKLHDPQSLLFLCLIVSFYLSLFISPSETDSWLRFLGVGVLSEISGEADISRRILFDIRLPRTLLSALSGASLAVAGVLSQGIFRNPLASPSLVGTQSGGVLFAVVGFHLLAPSGWPGIVPALAILGCLLSHLIISGALFRQSRKQGKAYMLAHDLVMMGLAIHILLAGITTLILSVALTDMDRSLVIFRWLFGSYTFASWSDVALIFSTFVLAGIMAVPLAYQLDVFSLSENEAISLSLNTHQLRQKVLFAISLLVGGSVAACGGIPFVGLMAPHAARLMVGAAHRHLLMASALIGMILTLACDVLARTVIYPEELEAGVLLVTLGGLFFFSLLLKKRWHSDHQL